MLQFRTTYTNITPIYSFYVNNNKKDLIMMVIGNLYYISFISFFASYSIKFSLVYIIYPFLEASFLLAIVNWSWHAFIDPENPKNEYVLSITILDGTYNILNEDYHVVHHKYPSAHWSNHQQLYLRDIENYKKNKAIIFKNIHAFQLFIYIMLKRYDWLSDHFIDISDSYKTKDDKIEMLKSRLKYKWE